jgi:hypothetical protein
MLAFEADDRGLRVQRPQPAEVTPAQRLDGDSGLGGLAAGAVKQPGGWVVQTLGTFGSKAVALLLWRWAANPESRSNMAQIPARPQLIDHQHSITCRGSDILISVHPGLRVEWF